MRKVRIKIIKGSLRDKHQQITIIKLITITIITIIKVIKVLKVLKILTKIRRLIMIK
jgi:hypothetical protein